MDSLNRNYLKYALVFLLGLSIAFNLLFYLRLNGRCGVSQDKVKIPEAAQSVPQERPLERPQPPAASVPVLPVADEPNSTATVSSRQNRMSYDSHRFYYKDCDGTKAEGRLDIRIEGLRRRHENDNVIVTVEPKPEKFDSVDFEYNHVNLNGTFIIGKSYTVKIPKGTIVFEGETLRDDFCCIVKIEQPDPYIDFATAGPYYQTKAENGVITEWYMPIKHTNMDHVQVVLWGLEDRNMDVSENLISKYWDGDENAVTNLLQRLADVDVKLSGRKNARTSTVLDMCKLFPNLKPGVYAVTMSSMDLRNEDNEFNNFCYKRMVVLSDLAISTVDEIHTGSIAVCVRRLSDSSAVQDADISLVSLKRKIIAKAKSGADGTALLLFDKGIYKGGDRIETVMVKTKDDITYIRLDTTTQLSTSEFEDSDRAFNKAYYPFVYTERGVYKPGETVHTAVFVRERKDDRLSPAQVPVQIEVSDSKYDRIYQKTIVPNINGFLTFELPLSYYSPTGVYHVSCKAGEDDCGDCHFQVASFVPDRIKVNVKPDKEIISFDDGFNVGFSSEYYFGGRADDVKYSVKMYAKKDVPKHWRDYAVGNTSKSKVDLGDYAITDKMAKEGSVLLPSVKSRVKAAERELLTVPLCVYVQVSASERAASTVTNTATIHAMPLPYMLGLKYNGGSGSEHGSDADVEFRFLGLEKGKTVQFEKTDFRLRLQKSEWEYVLARNAESSSTRMEWRRVLKDVKTPESFTLDKESSVVTFPELADGNYILTATAKSDKEIRLETRLEFWHWSGAASSVHSTNPNIITATSDREKYLPGESATLKFTADYDGACFVAAGEDKVDYTGAFDVKRGENSIAIPIDKNALASKYHVSITVAGTVDGNTSRAFALLGLALDQKANRLGLKLEAPEKAEPNKKITVTLKADEAATAQIFAVDEGILSLTNYKTPDIFDFFHGEYASTFRSRDIYSLLFPKLAIDGVPKVGGGDEGEAAQRIEKLKEFESAVVVLGAIDIPESGTATAELPLPDHTGAMRIMAVAAGATKVDSTETTIIMRDKLSVLPSLPLAVAVGDKFLATFKLFNHENDATDAKLTVKLPPELKSDERTEFSVKLEKGKSVTIQLPLTAAVNGAFAVEFRLEQGESVVTGKRHVNVRSIIPFSTDARQTVLKPGENLELPPMTDEWQSVALRKLMVSANPASAVTDALEWLNNYPYGCLEQTTSKAFPMLFVDSLVGAGLVDEGFKAQAQKAIDGAVVALLAMRRGSRGFVGWIDSNSIWDEPSIYAAHFLFMAKSNIMTDNDRAGISAFLIDKVNNAPVAERAYALYVLSLMPNTMKWMKYQAESLISKATDSPDMVKFLCGAVLYNSGFATQGSPFVKSALDNKVWQQTSKGLPWMISSTTVRTSLVLSIAMDILPDHPATTLMAMELASHLRGDNSCWGTTRDNSFACAALGKFAAYHPHGEVRMTLSEGDEQPVEYSSDKFTRKLAKDSKVTLRNTGKSELFVRLTTSGIPAKISHEKDTVSVKKVILDKDGKPVTKVKHGDLLTVRIAIKSNAWLADAVLLDLVPGGFAIEDSSLATRAKDMDETSSSACNIARVEKRGDRYLMFGKVSDGREMVVKYSIRAVIPGTYAIPPTRVEDMYEPDKCGTCDGGTSITIDTP